MTLRVLALASLIAAAAIVWQTGAWRVVQPVVHAVANLFADDDTPAVAGKASVDETPAETSAVNPSPMPPDSHTIVTWRDKDGVTHFATSGAAPTFAKPHTLGETQRLAGFKPAVALSPEELAQRRDGPGLTPNARREKNAGNDSAIESTQQARELIQRQQDTLDAIRVQNAR